MHGMTISDARPEAMADVPGVCELPLTRAVVQYRDVHELDHPGGRIQDIGLAVIVEGRFASSARAIDLGSAEAKYLDLSSELVVLDWVYDPTLAHIRFLADAVSESPETQKELERYCFDLGLRVLNRTGFTPLTRATLLRIGFRDLCKDLDLHEGTVVRIVMDGNLARVHLDYDANSLVFRTGSVRSDPTLEGALQEVFRDRPIHRVEQGGRNGALSYEVRFGVPLSFAEARKSLQRMRRGLNHLIARYEPERFTALDGVSKTFGARQTLDRFAFREPRVHAQPLQTGTLGSGSAVH